jgi:hypothetical protein
LQEIKEPVYGKTDFSVLSLKNAQKRNSVYHEAALLAVYLLAILYKYRASKAF